MTTREDGWVLVRLDPRTAGRNGIDPDAPVGWMDPEPLPLDANGHCFMPDPDWAGAYCLGCGYPSTGPEARSRCEDADGLAEESTERVRYVAEHRVEVAAS